MASFEGLMCSELQPTLLYEERQWQSYMVGSSNVIATHAPVRGATILKFARLNLSEDCNPRSCTRSDAGTRIL